jgi:hypothetical protein
LKNAWQNAAEAGRENPEKSSPHGSVMRPARPLFKAESRR